jgi:hypothetical protein
MQWILGTNINAIFVTHGTMDLKMSFKYVSYFNAGNVNLPSFRNVSTQVIESHFIHREEAANKLTTRTTYLVKC